MLFFKILASVFSLKKYRKGALLEVGSICRLDYSQSGSFSIVRPSTKVRCISIFRRVLGGRPNVEASIVQHKPIYWVEALQRLS